METPPQPERSDEKPGARRLRLPRFAGRKPFLILGSIAAAIVLTIAVYLVLTSGRESTDDAQVDADVVALAPRVSGTTRRLHVRENQRVKRGEILFDIDDADFVARVDQAQAEVETTQAQAQAAQHQVELVIADAQGGFSSAQAQVSGSSGQARSAEAQVNVARAGLRRAQATAHQADTDLARARRLREANAVPQDRLDAAQTAYDTTQAAVAESLAQVRAAEDARRAAQSRIAEAEGRLRQTTPIQSQIAVAQSNARLAQARVRAAEAALQVARLQLSYTRIVAPADGVVSQMQAREGELAQAGTTLASLVPEQSYVTANFKETQIGRMRPGQRAVITIDAFPGKRFEGRVESLSGGTGARFSLLPPENATGNFVKVVQRVPVRISWTRLPEAPVRAGLSLNVKVYVDE